MKTNKDEFIIDSIQLVSQSDKELDNRQKKGLGRGLSSLLGDSPEKFEKNNVAIKDLVRNKFQPRSHFEKESLDELTASIKEQGVIQPIVVRPSKLENSKYDQKLP